MAPAGYNDFRGLQDAGQKKRRRVSCRGFPFLTMKNIDEMKKRYRYRRMILDGTLKTSKEAALAFVGPDCAYHLYARRRCGREAGHRGIRQTGQTAHGGEETGE